MDNIKKRKYFVFLVLLLILMVAVALAVSIKGKKKNEGVEYVIGMSQANLSEPWRIFMNEEIKNETKKYNNIKIVYKDAGGDTEKQKNDINELLESGIDLLIVSINDSQKLSPVVSKAYKSIPVIVLDRAVEGYDYTLYIGPDNEAIGRKAGKLVADLIGDKQGKVIEVQGLLNSPPVIGRSNGFREVIKDYKNISISRTIICEWQKDEAEDKLTDILQQDKDVDVIFAHNDYMALGAYKALYKLGMNNVKVIGVDGLTGPEGGLDLVSKNILKGTFTCPTGGKEAVSYAVDILTKKQGIPKKVILRSDKITAENVDIYLNEKTKLPKAKDKIVLGYVQPKPIYSWRYANTISIKQAAKEANMELVFLECDNSEEQQKEAVRELISKRVDVIAFSPLVEGGWDEVLNEAKKAGIPVVTSDRNVNSEDSLWISNISSDFSEQGRRSGRILVEQVAKTETKVLEIQGNFGSTPAMGRHEGFVEATKGNKNIKIVEAQDGEFTYEGGKKVMEVFLSRYGKSINVVYAHNDDMALGAIEAIKNYGLMPGKDILVIGIDGAKKALEEIKKGEMFCTVECTPILGIQLVKTVQQVLNGIEVPVKIINVDDIFTKENITNKIIRSRAY